MPNRPLTTLLRFTVRATGQVVHLAGDEASIRALRDLITPLAKGDEPVICDGVVASVPQHVLTSLDGTVLETFPPETYPVIPDNVRLIPDAVD